MESEKVKEIKEALENCTNNYGTDCYHCPYLEKGCNIKLMEDSLTLINELEKENGELKKHITEVEKGIINIARERNKKEELASKFIDSYNDSLKQFAERLKDRLRYTSSTSDVLELSGLVFDGIEVEQSIDETLKEFIND